MAAPTVQHLTEPKLSVLDLRAICHVVVGEMRKTAIPETPIQHLGNPANVLVKGEADFCHSIIVAVYVSLPI